MLHDGRGIVEVGREVGDLDIRRQVRQLGAAVANLQADKSDARHPRKRQKRRQRRGPFPVAAVGRTALPGDTDAKAADPIAAVAPGGHPRRIGIHIGNVRGDLRHVESEQLRQAHQRAPDVIVRQCAAPGDNFRYTCQPLKQGPQLGGTLQDHLAVTGGQQFGQPRELDRVAEALFGVEQERASGERGAVP